MFGKGPLIRGHPVLRVIWFEKKKYTDRYTQFTN